MKTYKLKINGTDYEVAINGINDGRADVSVNGVSYDVQVCDQAAVPSAASGACEKSAAVSRNDSGEVSASPAKSIPSSGETVTSPLPGVVLKVSVCLGEAVRRGQQVAVIEAMKMENEILCETDGVVKAIFVTRGDSILEGDKVLTIE